MKIIVNIYIPNLRRKCYNEEERLEEIEKYLFVLIEKNIEKAKRIGENIGIMEEYIEEIVEASETEEWGEAYNKEEALIDYGEQKGEQKKQLEIAYNLLKMKMPIEQISEATSLSIEEVEHLKEK